MDPLRTQRVSEAMRLELSELIRFEASDPRLLGIEVTAVILAPDMSRADVLVSLPPESTAKEAALAGLIHAKPFLRHQLSQRIDLFRMPELRFVADSETGKATGLDQLKRRINRGRPRQEG